MLASVALSPLRAEVDAAFAALLNRDDDEPFDVLAAFDAVTLAELNKSVLVVAEEKGSEEELFVVAEEKGSEEELFTYVGEPLENQSLAGGGGGSDECDDEAITAIPSDSVFHVSHMPDAHLASSGGANEEENKFEAVIAAAAAALPLDLANDAADALAAAIAASRR